MLVRHKLKEKKIQIAKAKISGDTTKVYLKTPNDFRNLTKELDLAKRTCHKLLNNTALVVITDIAEVSQLTS